MTQTVDRPSDHLLRTLAAVPVHSRVLDLGCGAGAHTEPLALLGFDVWGCDASAVAVERTRERLHPVLGDEEAQRRITTARPAALGYPDDHFDWVVALESLETAADASALVDILGEIRRVLKPGGWVFAGMRREAVGPDLTPETLAKLFCESGFALSEEPAEEGDLVRGIFRRVEEGVGS